MRELRLYLSLLCLFFAGMLTMNAQDETVTLSSLSASYLDYTEAGKFSMKFEANGGTAPTYNGGIRQYAKNTVTLKALGQYKLKSAVFTVTAAGYSFIDGTTASAGSLAGLGSTTTTWTASDGGDSEVTITRGGTSGHARISKIVVTLSLPDDGLLPANLSFGAETEFVVKLGDTFKAPELTKETDADAVYSSENTSVADVDSSTGAVTIIGAGTTVIKAAVAETPVYRADVAEYTLIVKDPNAIGDVLNVANFGISTSYKDYTYGPSADSKVTYVANAYNSSGMQFNAATTGIRVSANPDGLLVGSLTITPASGMTTANQGNGIELYVSDKPFTDMKTAGATLVRKITGQDPVTIAIDGDYGYFLLTKANCTGVYKLSEVSVSWRPAKPAASLSWNEPEASLWVGATPPHQLPNLINTDGVEVSYASSDATVATIDAVTGEVTPVGVGETIVTASFAGNGQFAAASASYTLTVIKKSADLGWTLNGEAWNATRYDAVISETTVFPAVSNPDGLELMYESSDESVAAIDMETGEITLVGKGETVITVIHADDRYADQTLEYTLVVSRDDDIVGLTITPESGNITVSDEISVSCATEGVTYTLMVTDKKTNSLVKELDDVSSVEPFSLPRGEYTVEVLASKEGMTGAEATAEYVVSGLATGLRWTVDAVTVEFGQPFAAPRLESDIEGLEIVYVSGNEGVATISEEGILQIVGTGETQIHAMYEGDETYEEAEAVYTLTVTGGAKEGSYTITFKSSTTATDSSTSFNASSAVTNVVTGESKDYVSGIAAASYSYNGKSGYGLKIGKSGTGGSLELKLSDLGKVNVTRIVADASMYAAGKDVTLNINGAGAQSVTSTSFGDYTYSFDGSVAETIKLASSNYMYVKSLTVYYKEGSDIPALVLTEGETEIAEGAEVAGGTVLTVNAPADWTLSYRNSDGEFAVEKGVIKATIKGLYTVTAADPDGRYLLTRTFTVKGVVSENDLDFTNGAYGMKVRPEGSWQAWDGVSFTGKTDNNILFFIPFGQHVALREGGLLEVGDGYCFRIASKDEKVITGVTIEGEGVDVLTYRRVGGNTSPALTDTDIFTDEVGSAERESAISMWTPKDGEMTRSVQVVCGNSGSAAGVRSYVARAAGSSAMVNKISVSFDTPTGVETVTVFNGAAEIYDLNGNRVNGENLRPGIYVVRDGGKTTKIMVK